MKAKGIATVLGGALLVASLLGGCSAATDGASAADGSVNQQTDAAQVDAESKEATYWQCFEVKSHSTFTSSTSPSVHDGLLRREYDDAGNLVRVTDTTVSRRGGSNADEFQDLPDPTKLGKDEYYDETVTEYTYDDKGWPLTRSKKKLLPVDEWVDGKKTYSEPEVANFSFERDKEGRLVRASGLGLGNSGSDITAEFDYYDSGEPKTISWSMKTFDYDDPETDFSDGPKVTQKTVEEYTEEGTATRQVITNTDESGAVIKREEIHCDEKGNEVQAVTTRPQKEGEDLVSTCEYKNEYEDGRLVKQEAWIYGDGVTETRSYIGDDYYAVIRMPDGSATATKLLGKWDSDALEYIYVCGGTQTLEPAPYVSYEWTYSADGVRQKSVYTWFDGDVNEHAYDAHGLPVSNSGVSGTSKYKNENLYERIQIPSDFVCELYRLHLESLDDNLSMAYAQVE